MRPGMSGSGFDFGPILGPVVTQALHADSSNCLERLAFARRHAPGSPIGERLKRHAHSVGHLRHAADVGCASVKFGFVDHDAMVNALCSSSQQFVFAHVHTAFMGTDVWDRVMGEATLQARERPQQWLADRLSEVGPKRYTIQRIQNWKVRGIPRGEYPSIALAIGRSSDWVAGMEASGRSEFGSVGIAASTGHAMLTPGTPLPAAGRQALRAALGQIAEKMRAANRTEREMLALVMRDVAVRPEALETTLGTLFKMLGTKSSDEEVRRSRQVRKNAKRHKN